MEKENPNPFYIDIPWSPQTYFTVRGSENFHIILWISKDLSWTQGNQGAAMFFGVAALSWCVILAYHALVSKNWEEVYMLVPMILWLTANFIWMYGEVFNGDDDYVVPRVAIVMETAIAWILLYHVVLRPFKLIPQPSKELTDKYAEADLIPRFSYFQNWRQYEHMHTLCWLGKDLSWDQDYVPTWIMCLIPTFLIAADFIYVTWSTKKMTIDVAHYVAQLMWVLGNMVWAMGELFDINGEADDDETFFIFNVHSSQAARQCRWWSSWTLFAAYIPIVGLYFVWLPLTCTGHIKAAEISENSTYGRDSVNETCVNSGAATWTNSVVDGSVESINIMHMMNDSQHDHDTEKEYPRCREEKLIEAPLAGMAGKEVVT